MSYGPMIGLADLVRVLSVAKSEEEGEAMAKGLGYEKKEQHLPDEENDEENDDDIKPPGGIVLPEVTK